MAINSDIRDQAYQFFLEEAPELLHELETGLLSLRQERSTAKVHNLMRAAHSIKGGAASVGLGTIAKIAHRLETILKALYSDTLEIDTSLENQLLQAYDCLRLPLTEQITVGSFNEVHALALAEPVFVQIEQRCGEALLQADSYMPSSADLGVNMVASFFEVDVTQGLERLAAIVSAPQDYEVAGELRAQAEVFAGFAELLSLPQFGAIAATVQAALQSNPDRSLEIAQLALAEFEQSRQAVLAGDLVGGVGPSAALVALTVSDATIQTDSLLVETEIAEEFPSLLEADLDWAVTAAESELVDSSRELAEEAAMPLLEDMFGFAATLLDPDTLDTDTLDPDTTDATAVEVEAEWVDTSHNLDEAIQSIEQIFDRLPSLPPGTPNVPSPPLPNAAATKGGSLIPAEQRSSQSLRVRPVSDLKLTRNQRDAEPIQVRQSEPTVAPSSTIRVDSDRLERMNNLVGELAINRDGLSLQNEQLQGSLRDLLNRFARFQTLISRLRALSDQMLVAPERRTPGVIAPSKPKPWELQQSPLNQPTSNGYITSTTIEFDSLEMDQYGTLNAQLQGMFEEVVQLEEVVNDVTLFAQQSDTLLDDQRHMLNRVRDELIWARMLPLSEILNRFPRVLRDLSTTYQKPVKLKLVGTGVLVDRAILEKLYDPLLHLLRNAFDHGIEPTALRQQQGKPEEGQIEIRAYHKGNQTIIEVRDDGRGINLDRIHERAIDLGWVSPDRSVAIPTTQLLDFIFEPGFSTAYQVSELSGRGVGLDVVRSQLRSIKGNVRVTSTPGIGTTFTLSLPLTLTIAKLIVCLVGPTALALPTDSIEEILTPQANQIKQSGSQRFVYWRDQIIPVHRLAEQLNYACPLPEAPTSKLLSTLSLPTHRTLPMLILRQDQQPVALEIDHLVTEQELVIKPYGAAIAAPSYAYGCTILADGTLVPVIEGSALLSFNLAQRDSESHSLATVEHPAASIPVLAKNLKPAQAPTILVVDDAVTLRRTMTLFLERSGFRVLQARDGQEAINQLQQSSSVQLIVCDIEMPNMNGFEFLNYRRQTPHLARIPVLMLTSRSNDKHRWLAMQLGATAYFTKPYLEQEFLAAIKTIIH